MSNYPPYFSVSDTLAVVVTYGQLPGACASIRSLEAEALTLEAPISLLVYDNSPAPASPEAMPDQRAWAAVYRHDPTNPGVSTAYLAGALLARSMQKRWLFLLDQDTSFRAGTLRAYTEAISRHTGVRLFCPILTASGTIISPCGFRWGRGTPLAEIKPGLMSLSRRSIVNSGLMISLDLYESAGGHNPMIPLDFSDHEFMRRVGTIEHQFAVVDTIAEHAFSGTASQSREAAERRFHTFCLGAVRTARDPWSYITFFAAAVMRGARLALRHRHPAFLRVPFSAAKRDWMH